MIIDKTYYVDRSEYNDLIKKLRDNPNVKINEISVSKKVLCHGQGYGKEFEMPVEYKIQTTETEDIQ